MRQNDGPAGAGPRFLIESRRILHKSVKKSTRAVSANPLNRPDATRTRACRGSARCGRPGRREWSASRIRAFRSAAPAPRRLDWVPPARWGHRPILAETSDGIRKTPVVPAKAGTQWRRLKSLGSRLRGNDGVLVTHFGNAQQRTFAADVGRSRCKPRHESRRGGQYGTRSSVPRRAAQCAAATAAARVGFIARRAPLFRKSAGSSRAS